MPVIELLIEGGWIRPVDDGTLGGQVINLRMGRGAGKSPTIPVHPSVLTRTQRPVSVTESSEHATEEGEDSTVSTVSYKAQLGLTHSPRTLKEARPPASRTHCTQPSTSPSTSTATPPNSTPTPAPTDAPTIACPF